MPVQGREVNTRPKERAVWLKARLLSVVDRVLACLRSPINESLFMTRRFKSEDVRVRQKRVSAGCCFGSAVSKYLERDSSPSSI